MSLDALIAALLPLVQQHPLFAALLAGYSLLVTLASLITAVTGTPDPATPLGKLYRILELVALVVGKAKERVPAPPADGTGRLTGSPLAVLFGLLLVGAVTAPLGGCVTAGAATAAVESGGAAVGGVFDTGAATVDAVRDAAGGLADKLYQREVALICRKSIRAHAQAIADGVMPAKALPLLCPDIDAFASTILGAR